MSSNSITHFISTAKDLSDLLYIEKFFEKHSLTPLSLENCIVNDLERLFESVLNTPIPNSEHMKGLLGIIKCLRQISLCKGDEQWLILYERVSTLISKCTRYIMTHLDVDNTLFSEILQLILQIIIDSSRHHISIKNKMLQCLSPLIFDIIVNKKPPLALEKLCIQSLTLLVTRTDQERRKEVMELVYPKLAKFFDHLYTCGDYDTQLCIVETILRFIVPDKNRKMFFVNFKHKNPNVIRNFLNVRSKDFDTEQELFWVDFNRGALSVSIWCNKNSLLTPEERAIPDFVSSTDWQLLTIKPEVVTEVKVKSIKPCDEVQRNFIEIQFIINRPLEIRPLEEIMCTQSRSVRILFPRSKETEALEYKVLSSIFKMRKLDGMCKQNKVNDESDRRNKCISSAKVHMVGMVNSSSFNNISRMPFSKEERCQKLKETDENVTKERSKSWASGRKISTTKTNIEFQSFLDSDEEKEGSPRKTSTKQVSDISDSELNHRTARHSERVDEAKSSVAGRSLLDKNQEENNEEIARNQHNVEEKEDNQKIIKTNTNMHLNSTKPKTRYAKMSTTVEKCNFFERIPENCRTSMNFHSDNKSLNSNSYLRIGQSPPEIHASTKDATDISHKNLSKEKLRTEVVNEKMKQNLNANYVENLSEKGIRESKTECKSHKENVKVSRSINTCQLNVPGHKMSFSSSNQNLINPLSKKNAKEIDVLAATIVNNTENRIEERRTIKISTSADKCTFKLKKGEKKDIFPQSLNKTISSSESRKVNHLLQPNNTEDQQTSKYQDCNIKMNDLKEFPIESKNSENNDNKTRRVSNSCLFESMEKNTVTQDALNHTDILPNEISTDKMMSKVNINDENVDDNKSKEAKNVTHVDLNHEFHNSEKKIETNSLSPKNEMTEAKKFTKTDEVIPYTENGKINVKGTSRTTCFDSSKEFLNSKIKERVSDLLPSTKSRFFKTSECSQKQSLQTNTANKIKNERSTEQTVARSRKQSQFNSEKGASDVTPPRRRSKRIQSARGQSENIFKSSALNTSRKRDEKQDSDNDFDEKKHFENISMKRLQTTRKEKLRKDFVDAPCISDKYIDRNRQEVMDTEIANKVQFEGTHFRRKLKKDNADCVINKIQDLNVGLSGKRNVCENLCKSPQDKKTEIKFVSKHENNNQESNCKLLVTETPSPILVENCINQSNEETTNTMKTSRFLISEIISVNEENNHNTEEERKQHLKVKHSIGKTQSQSRSLKKYRKPTELCEAKACESSFQTCSSGTEVTEGAEVNGHNLVHNNSENNDNNNSKCLQEREKDINLSNELSHAECVNLIVDCKEIYTENRGSDSETVINIEGKSQDVIVHNEVQENPNSENNVNNSKNNKESDTKEGSAQLLCSQSDVSHIVTNAIVHNSSQSSSPIDNQYIEKSGVDTVITHSVKVFKFFTQNITSVENKNNDSLYFQDENKTNTTKHIANASVKDSVEKVYIQETVTSKKQSTNCGKKGKAAETHCEDSNEKHKVNKINEGTCASIKEGKTENFKKINSSRKKKNLHPVSRSEIKPITTRALRKRKAVSYTYNSPIYTQEEQGKGEVNHCSHNKVGRSSVKKRLFTQNEVDIVSLCSGSQNSCLAENGIQEVNIKEIPLDTKKCDPSKSQNNSHDEFDKLLITSPPPLPIRNPNHWKEKYRKDIQMMSLKQTSSNQKIVNSKKTKHSVYSDLDSSSDMSVFFDNADHERKAIAVEDSEKTNFVSLIKIKNTVSEINSKSKDPQSEEKNALFHLNPNNSNDTLHINNTILSPKVNLNKPPSSIEEERNSKVHSINPQKNADEVVMDKAKQGFQQDAEPFVKNSIMDVEPEKMKMRHSKIQIKSENNKEIDCNSKNKKGEQIIQQGNSEKLVYMMSIYNNKRITTQTGKSINNEGCSKQLQEHNVNCSLAETAVYQDTNSENKLNEVSSVQQNKEAQNKVENIKFNESIHESNQKDLCKKKRKLIVYSDTDSDCNVSVSAPKEKYQNEETYTAKLQIKKSNEYFSENENKGFETNATNRDTSRNVNLCLNPKDSIERLQTNELTLQLTSEEITDQPEILVNNIEYSKQLQLEKGNNCITTDHVTQNIGCNDEMSKFAVQQNNEVQLQSRKEIVKHCSVNAKTQGHEQAEYFIEEKIKNNINKRRKHVSRGQNKQKGSTAFQCNENCTNKSTHYETKCNTLNKIDRIPTCREQELQISLMHSMNEKENSNEINDIYVNDAETVKDQRIIERTPLKCIDTFENKRKKHRNFQKLIKNNEISPLFLKNRYCNKKFLNIDNYNSQTLINKEYMQGTDSQIGYKNSIKKTAANCSKENVRSDNVLLNGSKTLNKDKRRIRNTKELSERQKVVGSHIYRNFHTLQPKGQLEINGKLNTDDNVSTEENGLSNQETHFCAVSSIKSNEIVKRQSKGQIQSKKSTSKVGYEMHKNQIEHRFLQKPLVCKWNSETDGSSLSSPETTNEFSEEQSTSVRKIKRRKLKTSFLKKEFQKSTRGKKKCIKEFSCNISNSLLGHFSQSSHIFHARRTDSRKHLNNNVGHKIEKIKNSIQTLDSFIESMEERIAEVNGMVMNQNYIEEDIKQNFIHIENEYMKFAADLSNEPKFDVQHLISSLGEKFRKETLRNMLKKLHNVYDTSL